MKVLYLSYDGALDPLGQSQIIPYLEGLAALGHRFDLVTHEKRGRWEQAGPRRAMTARLNDAGVTWHPLPYHKRVSPVATAFDVNAGIRLSRRLQRRRGFDLVHARSYPSTLVAWRLLRHHGVPFVFDMRGLYAEERVDGDLWPAGGLLYRTTKRLESRFLRDAAAVVTLTQASLPKVQAMVLGAGGQGIVEVIPTSVELDRFGVLGPPSPPLTLSYVGSVGTWYMLPEMLAFARCLTAQTEGARVRFIVNQDHQLVRTAARNAGLPDSQLEVVSVPYAQVPDALADSWATFGFIRAAPSKIASAATKVSESLALGLPIAVNRGVGDAAELVERHAVGVVVDPHSPATFPEAVSRLRDVAADPSIRSRCRGVAERYFDVRTAVESYDRIYEKAGRHDVRSGI